MVGLPVGSDERLCAMFAMRPTRAQVDWNRVTHQASVAGNLPQDDPMIDLYYAPTPNGWKISIMLEEIGLPYRVIPVNIRAGEQFKPDFLAISPNNRIPAIVDDAPPDGGEPFSVFETGAILIYLADKTGRFLPTDMRGRSRVVQWVMWQMGGLGPMLGQHGHFALYAPEEIPYAIERYRDEAARLYRVLDTQLGKTGAYVAGDYSIADIACFPWTMTHKAQGFTLDDYPNVKRWYAEVRARPQVQAGLAIGKFVKEPFDEDARRNMFGQKAKELAQQK
jgi:GST-like protein